MSDSELSDSDLLAIEPNSEPNSEPITEPRIVPPRASTPSFGDEAGDAELVLLANRSMRARTRPGMVFFLWLWQLVFAIFVTWPTAALVDQTYGGHPRGDAVLFEPGGLVLADFVWHARRFSGALLAHDTIFAAFSVVGGLLPLAALLASMTYTTRARRSPRPRQLARFALDAFGRMLALLFIAGALEILFVGIAMMLGAYVSDSTAARMGEARSDQLGWLVTILFFGIALAVGVLHDLARASVVRFWVGALKACGLAWNTFRRHPVSLFGSWGWRAGAGIVPIAAASMITDRIGLKPGSSVVAIFALHQVVIGARIALRASWLANAVRAVDHAHRVLKSRSTSARTASEKAARSGEPGAPIRDPVA
ncbi:MAG: hypothetical protein ABIP39_15670 [Polyangiaceae bacterium]